MFLMSSSKPKPTTQKILDKPIKLIEKKNGELTLNDDGLSFLKQIQGNLAICVCVGPYRQGKSFLLNQILKKKTNGFDIGHKDDPCTYGVWIHEHPVKIKDQSGNESTIILMDTEAILKFKI